MPYHVTQSGSCPTSRPWACVNSQTGRVMGCHDTQGAARQQMAALYANEPGASTRDAVGRRRRADRPPT